MKDPLKELLSIKKERPKFISKLALYLQDKEPLIYLFIINSDFYNIDGTDLLPKETDLGGVFIYNRRVKYRSLFCWAKLYNGL